VVYASPGNAPRTPRRRGVEPPRRTDMQHVPFKGGAPSLQAVLAGDVQVMIARRRWCSRRSRRKLVPLALITRAASKMVPACPDGRAACRAWTRELVGHWAPRESGPR